MNDINILLKNILKTKDNKEKYLNAFLQDKWEEIAGVQIADKSYPDKVADKILFLSVVSPAWSHNLLTMKNQLLDKVNSNTSLGIKIKDIKFSVKKNIKKFENQEYKVKKIVFPDLDELEEREIKELACVIEDEKVAFAAYMALKAAKKRQKYYILKGFSICEKCGTILSYKSTVCIVCDKLQKNKLQEDLIKEFYHIPWLRYDDIKDAFKINYDEFVKIRNECREIFKNKVLQKDATNNDLRRYAMIKTGISASILTEKDINGVLKNLGRY